MAVYAFEYSNDPQHWTYFLEFPTDAAAGVYGDDWNRHLEVSHEISDGELDRLEESYELEPGDDRPSFEEFVSFEAQPAPWVDWRRAGPSDLEELRRQLAAARDGAALQLEHHLQDAHDELQRQAAQLARFIALVEAATSTEVRP